MKFFESDEDASAVEKGIIHLFRWWLQNALKIMTIELWMEERQQIKIFIEGLFSFDQDCNALKEHLRDFLVQIREFAGEDLDDLFLEERETTIRTAQDEKRKQQLAVPGILGPHEVPEEMQD